MVSSNVFKGTAIVASTLAFMMIGFYVQDEVMKAAEVRTAACISARNPGLTHIDSATCSVE